MTDLIFSLVSLSPPPTATTHVRPLAHSSYHSLDHRSVYLSRVFSTSAGGNVVHGKFVVAFFSHDVRQASKQASWNASELRGDWRRMTDLLIWIRERLVSAELSLPVRKISRVFSSDEVFFFCKIILLYLRWNPPNILIFNLLLNIHIY